MNLANKDNKTILSVEIVDGNKIFKLCTEKSNLLLTMEEYDELLGQMEWLRTKAHDNATVLGELTK